MNAEGKKMEANAVQVNYKNNTHNLDAIIQDNFPLVAQHIKAEMPEKKKVKDGAESQELVEQMEKKDKSEKDKENWMINDYR